ncbi:MAG: transporter substrate-binding domain-containing protein, partial [Bacteroidetes bacterium]|nr:transporter substrate-binding domain-containing protein [Bacteroidota bacterium]
MRLKRTYLINFLLFSVISIIIVIGCRNNTNEVLIPQQPQSDEYRIYVEKNADLDQIRKRGKLIALTDNSTTSYFIYKGQPMGYEYDLLSMLAEHLGVDLEIKVVKNMDDIIEMLIDGKGDIIAANLTVTKERARVINFTKHHILTQQVLVQRKPRRWKRMKNSQIEKRLIRNPIDLIGKEVHVRKNSSFYSRLQSLSDEIGGDIRIIQAFGNYETEYLISMVAEGVIDYTVADENVALVNQNYYPNIDVKTAISFPQKIAWAISKDAPQLLEEINKWIKGMHNKSKYIAVYNKYFKNHQIQKQRVESGYFYLSKRGGGRISKYDHIIKTYSKEINWDWRLLASQMYQESNFDPDAESWAGAFGLMQLMPATASIYGVDTLSSAAQNVMAGTQYLSWLDNYWKNIILDRDERIKFVLASYNAGLGHVIDARNLAEKYGQE